MSRKKESKTTESWQDLTKPVLMKHEKTRILATRIAQFQGGAPPNLTPEELSQVPANPEAWARLELALRKTPMIIERTLPGTDTDGQKRKIEIPIQELD